MARQRPSPESTLGEKISAFLSHHGINQREFAGIAGVDPSQISKLMNGNGQLGPKSTSKVLNVLKTVHEGQSGKASVNEAGDQSPDTHLVCRELEQLMTKALLGGAIPAPTWVPLLVSWLYSDQPIPVQRGAFDRHADCLIAYGENDRLIAKKIGYFLSRYESKDLHRTLKVWQRDEDLLPGDPIRESLQIIVQHVGVVLVVIGPNGIQEWPEEPVLRSLPNSSVRIVPVLVGKTNTSNDFLADRMPMRLADQDDVEGLKKIAEFVEDTGR